MAGFARFSWRDCIEDNHDGNADDRGDAHEGKCGHYDVAGDLGEQGVARIGRRLGVKRSHDDCFLDLKKNGGGVRIY